MSTQYTSDKNAFVQELIGRGYARKDISVKYTASGAVVEYPVIGDDGKPHLIKTTFKKG